MCLSTAQFTCSRHTVPLLLPQLLPLQPTITATTAITTAATNLTYCYYTNIIIATITTTAVDVRAWEAAGRPEPLGLLMTDAVGVALGGSIIDRFMRIDYPGYQLAREAFVNHMQSQKAHPYHVWGALGTQHLSVVLPVTCWCKCVLSSATAWR
jgi:hypothetical protein